MSAVPVIQTGKDSKEHDVVATDDEKARLNCIVNERRIENFKKKPRGSVIHHQFSIKEKFELTSASACTMIGRKSFSPLSSCKRKLMYEKTIHLAF